MRFGKIKPHGAAMAMVVILMALATLMAYALLENSSLQALSASNMRGNAQADGVAESGVSLAMYYLQNPTHAPSTTTSVGNVNVPVYWPGASNITFSGVPGTATVTVSPSGTTGLLFSISSTGTSSSTTDGTVSKTCSGVAEVVYKPFYVSAPLTMGSNVTIGTNMTVNSGSVSNLAIMTTGSVTVSGSGHVTGTVEASSASNGLTVSTPPLNNPVPASNTITNYSTYTYNGTNYSAGGGLLGVMLGTYTPNSNNPLGIEATSSALSISALTNVTGTLYVNGNVTVAGAVTITSPQALTGANFIATNTPALVVTGSITLLPAASLTVKGLVYAGGGITGGLLGSTNITGGLVLGSPGFQGYSGSINVTYNSNYVGAGTLSSSPPALTPQSVKLTSWKP